MQITSTQIRNKFIEYFKENWHEQIPSAPVVPENDPTVLFTTAGMHPLVPYLLGEKHPLWKRLVNSQKCIRTGDIDEVGDDSHLTFFEMLWNWSLWDFFKKESIKFSYELLTEKLWIDPKKLAVTVFAWDENAPVDEESAIIWQEVGMDKNKISYLWKKDNWWGPAGQTWPCGPDTEIFYWVWNSDFSPEESNVENDEDNWMEIWNNVFMEYIKDEKWDFNLASMQNVDTGMWLERVTAVLNWKTTVYDTDVFTDIIEEIEKVLWVKYDKNTKKSIRIIADHARTSVIMLSDGVTPSNIDQWYVLRRLMRRAIREGYKLWKKGQFLTSIVEVIIWKFEDIYESVKVNKTNIIEEIEREEKQFSGTLEKWLKEFDKLLKWFQIALERSWKRIDTIAWTKAFKLYDTFGFPLEMTVELAIEKWLKVDGEWFNKAFEEHQAKSRAWAEQKFKWWLADDSEATTALHSATHLLLAGLKKYLWNDVSQKWSNITAERLRFDFNYPEKVEKDILEKVEEYVNDIIAKKCTVELINMDKTEAKESWVDWSFWEKYPDIVKVYTFKDNSWSIYSRELCWWPHVENTWSMWTFKIKKEQASSRGIRRIKAVLIK